MSWNPLDWFNNRAGGMSDGATESWFDQNPGGVRETFIGGGDGGIGPTSVYNTWKDYDAGISSGSYSNESPSFVNQFGKGFLQEYMNNNKSSKENEGGRIGWLGGGKQGGFTTSPIGKSGRNTLVQLHHPQATVIPAAPSQRSGSGIGGLIGSGLGYFVGNAIAPGIGGKIGGSLGGSIGSSF